MFINDGPRPNGWRWQNPIAQVDLWPQITYDPNTPPATFVLLTFNSGGSLAGTTTLTLVTPGAPASTPNSSYAPAFYPSMEYRQIWLNGNPPTGTPGFFGALITNTGTATGTPFTILQYLSPTQIVVDGNATLPVVTITGAGSSVNMNAGTNLSPTPTPIPTTLTVSPWAAGGTYKLNVTNNTIGTVLTATIAYNAIASVVQSTLNTALGASGSCTVTETGSLPGATYTVTFAAGTPTTYLALTANVMTGTQVAAPFSMASTGDYTLPANFGGQYTGDITFIANTNRGMILSWVNETFMRFRRQNYNIESGTPYIAAVRLMPTPSYLPLTNTSGLMLSRRRWELITWRISSEFLSIVFPYALCFNNLVNATPGGADDVPPCPFFHDEAVKAAILAVAELEVLDTKGLHWEYYKENALPNSWRIDAQSAPKALGYFGNAKGGLPNIQAFRSWFYQRPTVGIGETI